MTPSLTSCNVDDRLHRIVVSKDCQIDDRFPVASLILRSQAQCRSSYLVHFLQDIDMFTQFLPASRHLGFEDVQTMVDLISDPVQISSLLIDTVVYDGICSDLCNLLCYLVPFCHPLVPSCTSIKGIQADAILRSNEASSLTSKELSLNDFPIDSQCFTHKSSLYDIVHQVNESLIQGIVDSTPSNIHPLYLSGRSRRGRGSSERIGIMEATPITQGENK